METIDYGPLRDLLGVWKGDKGLDIAPDPEGSEENPFYETIRFEGAGYAINAEKQKRAAIRYHQEVRRKSDDTVFHDQTGYWMWVVGSDVVYQSLAIPRAVCVLATGRIVQNETGIEIVVEADETNIAQSSFMRENAKTLSFKQSLNITQDTLAYKELTLVDIYGKVFEHTDENSLNRG